MKTLVKTGFYSIILVIGFIIVSCQSASKKTGEKMMENAIENATGKKADVDLSGEKAVIKTGDGSVEFDGNAKSWPSGIPGDVPRFDFGKVDGVTSSDVDGLKTWTIIFKEPGAGFLDKYEAQLKEKGFETSIFKMGDKTGSVTGESDKFTVGVMAGEDQVVVSVQIKKVE